MSSSSRPAREPARRPCSWSGSPGRCATAGSMSTRSWSSPTRSKAAGELRDRIRARLVEAGRPDLARELDGAWISTIHGFCHRLLRAYPFAAGIDPRFRVLDESQSRVLQREAFEDALGEFSQRMETSAAPPRPPTARAPCGACSRASTRPCAPPGGRSSSSWASGPGWPSAAPSWAKLRAASPTMPTPERPPGRLPGAPSRCSRSAPCPSGSSISPSCAPAGSALPATRRRAARSSRRRLTSSRPATATCSRSS